MEMDSRPWQFPDNAVEMRYHAFVYQTFVDRSKDLIRIHFLCILVMNIVAGTVKYFVLDKRDHLEDAVMALRFVGTTSLAYFYLSKWSDSMKPMAARIYFWVGRLFYFAGVLVEAGILRQPDSQVKFFLVWYLFGGGIFTTTFEEYLGFAFVLTYLELARLLILGGPCPVDSSRICTTYELFTHFVYHTLYLGVAVWMHHYTHSERRKDFVAFDHRHTPAVPIPAQNPYLRRSGSHH